MRALVSSLLILFFSTMAVGQNADPFGNLGNVMQSSGVMTVEEAFQLNAFENDARLHADFIIAPGMKLYQHKLSFTSDSAQLGPLELPPADDYVDPEFGEVKVYHEMVSIEIPIIRSSPGDVVTIRYQGCSTSICYPPVERAVTLSQHIVPAQPVPQSAIADEATSVPNGHVEATQTTSTASTKAMTPELAPPAEGFPNGVENDSSDWSLLVFFVLGLGLALTPCVFPMYPIMSSVVIGSGKKSTAQILTLSFSYVQGMAIVYSSMGIVVALAGVKFQIAMQQPWVMMLVSGLFVLLSGSMFGLFNFQLPAAYSNKLNEVNQKTQGGSILGAFAIGALSGLVASPCTTAPLAGVLMYVAQSGDITNGFLSLYALTMGMGVPLILFALTSGKLMPKAGNWMNYVKHGFGFVLLAVAIYFSSRFLAGIWVTMLYCLLGITVFTYIEYKNSLTAPSIRRSLIHAGALLGFVITATYGMFQWEDHKQLTTVTAQEISSHDMFERIDSMEEYQAHLTEAKEKGQVVMLDLYADWCSACLQYERNTFSNANVQASLDGVKLLQIDMSTNTEFGTSIQESMGIVGLPTIMFFDNQGGEMTSSRVTGYLDADDFISHIDDNKVTESCKVC